MRLYTFAAVAVFAAALAVAVVALAAENQGYLHPARCL